jgi:hypothetical protein
MTLSVFDFDFFHWFADFSQIFFCIYRKSHREAIIKSGGTKAAWGDAQCPVLFVNESKDGCAQRTELKYSQSLSVNIYVQSFRKDLAILIQTHYVELMVEPIAIFVLASV